MGDYKVRISTRALKDLKSIAKYIREDSPQNAEEATAALVELINSLAKSPRRFRKVGMGRHRTPVHVTLTHSFMVYYKIEDAKESVEIITVVRGTRRQPQRFC